MDFENDDIVVKLKDFKCAEKGYNIGKSNPAINTKYECCGKIIDLEDHNITREETISVIEKGKIIDNYGFEVQWENESINSYELDDLVLVYKKYRTIW